jgi:hypothetical protein
MALLWIDGFDNYGTGASCSPSGVMGRKYNYAYTNNTLETARLGSGKSVLDYYGGDFWTAALTTDSTLILGVAVRLTDVGVTSFFIVLRDGTTNTIWVTLNGYTSEFEVYRAASPSNVLLIATSGAKIRRNAWRYLELKLYCHATNGYAEVRVNGIVVGTFTGQTKMTGQTHDYNDRVHFSTAANFNVDLDDLYICDSTGGAPWNDFLGVCKVVTRKPVSDVVGKKDWTPQSGTDHYAMVDDGGLCDDNTTYVDDTVSGHIDQFEFEDVSDSGFTDIKGVALCADCRETDANNYTLIQRAERVSVSEGPATAIAGTNFETHVRIMEQDTEGVAWTPDNFDDTQFGVKVG